MYMEKIAEVFNLKLYERFRVRITGTLVYNADFWFSEDGLKCSVYSIDTDAVLIDLLRGDKVIVR